MLDTIKSAINDALKALDGLVRDPNAPEELTPIPIRANSNKPPFSKKR